MRRASRTGTIGGCAMPGKPFCPLGVLNLYPVSPLAVPFQLLLFLSRPLFVPLSFSSIVTIRQILFVL